MIKIENIHFAGYEPAIRGMRNPKNSWDRSDSVFCDPIGCGVCEYRETGDCTHRDFFDPDIADFHIGNNDLKLMKNLFSAGTEHRKYDRMIVVWMDITAPLYWWKEFDTYKVGTVADSCSTMHKIHSKEFVMDDFSHEHLADSAMDVLETTVRYLNHFRDQFNKTKDKDAWWNMIQLLPSSYNQKRTVMMNYEVCARIIEQRSNHKLDEWHDLIRVLKTLPYLTDIMEGCDQQ